MPASSALHFNARSHLKSIGGIVKSPNVKVKRGKSPNPNPNPNQIFPGWDEMAAELEGSNSNHFFFYRKIGSIASTAADPSERSGLEDSTSDPVQVQPEQGTGVLASDRNNGTGSEGDQKPSKWVVFGPTYGEDTEVNRIAKESAWQHIVGKKGGNESAYMRSVTKVEKAARESYNSIIAEQQEREPLAFVSMMVKDGCFFLQLALHILGGGYYLGHPDSSPYFGNTIDSSSWIPAMFYAGNQIPYIVIQALMKQEFFKGVIDRGTWQRPPAEDLAKLVLYQTVVEPQLKLKPKPKVQGSKKQPEPPSNILFALHNLLSGSEHDDSVSSEMREFRDLETGSEDKSIKIPSAGELYKLGIKLRKAERGISSIRFQNRGYTAVLFVPPFIIDTHTKDLLTSLVNLEQGANDSERELTAYIRFMRDLAPTYKDFKILESKGIILVKDENLKGTMVHMLNDLVSLHNSSFTLKFRQIRRKIKDYGGPPWRLISFMLGVLAVVQTIFTVLSYCIPRT